MKSIVFATALSTVLAVSVAPSRAQDLQNTVDGLQRQQDAWKHDVDIFEQRRAEKEAQLADLKRAPEHLKELEKQTEKDLAETAKEAAKDVPTAISGNDAKKAKAALNLASKELKASKDVDAAFQAGNDLVDGTVDQKIAALSQHVTDLKNKIAIYNAFIAGAQASIQQTNAAISAKRTQAWNTFLGKLAAAVQSAQSRADARHEEEQKTTQQAAQKANGGSAGGASEGHEGLFARGGDGRPGGSQGGSSGGGGSAKGGGDGQKGSAGNNGGDKGGNKGGGNNGKSHGAGIIRP